MIRAKLVKSGKYLKYDVKPAKKSSKLDFLSNLSKKNSAKSKGKMGMSKHRTCGKNNRNKTNQMQIVRELNEESQKVSDLKASQKNQMFSTIKQALD